uniref:Uncharacterized protein n=1 Tax=Romanomermis culicivorax TaxID=13658 RepID=A0A915K570_ROMCU
MYGFQWPGTESRVKTFKLVFLHVALPLLTWIYIIFGACVFYNIEQPHEILVKNQNLADLRHLQNKTIGQFYDRMKFWSCRKDEELIERLNFSETSYMHFRLREFDELMLFTYRAFQGGLSAKDIDAKSLKLDWTFFSSIFFSTTITS